MLHRILLLLTVIAACISAYLISTATSLATDFPLFGFFAITFPVIGAWLAGLRNPDRLTLIGVYAFVGWLLGCWILPSPSFAGIRGVNFSAYFPYDSHPTASTVSALLVLIGAVFTPRDQLILFGKRDYIRAALAIAFVGILLIPSMQYLHTLPAKSLANRMEHTVEIIQSDRDNPPEEVDGNEWQSLIDATAQAVRNCFKSPNDITDRPRFSRFYREVEREFSYTERRHRTKETLVSIWDEIEVLSTRGKEYSAKHRPAVLKNQSGKNKI